MIVSLTLSQELPHLRGSFIFSLFQNEREAMDISQSHLQQKSSAPPLLRRAKGFFVENKDKLILPCGDYGGLNNITVSNRYPLSIVTFALKLLKKKFVK